MHSFNPARISATYPIEVIVSVFIVITLVYFQLLNLVRTSDFLLVDDSTVQQSHLEDAFIPSLIYTKDNATWSTSATINDDAKSLWLNQYLINDHGRLSDSILQTLPSARSASTFSTKSILDSTTTLLSIVSDSSRTSTLDRVILNEYEGLIRKKRGGSRKYLSFFSRSNRSLNDGEENNEKVTREEMKSVTWMLFAIRAFVMRFYYLAKVRRAKLCLPAASL